MVTRGEVGNTIDFFRPVNKIGTKTQKYVDPSAVTNVPEAEPDLPIPFIFGRRRIDNPNTIDCGKPVTSIKSVTRVIEDKPFGAMALVSGGNTVAPKFDKLVHGRVSDTKTGIQAGLSWDGFPPTETIEYIETRVTFAIGLAMGPDVRVLNIRDEDDTIIFGDDDSSTLEWMDTDGETYDIKTLPDQTKAVFYSGSWTQNRNAALTNLPGRGADKTPAYRGTSYLVFPNALVSNAGIIAKLAFEIVRLPNPLALPEGVANGPIVGYTGPIGGGGVYNYGLDGAIPNCVWELLSSTWGGVALNTIFIDPVSFTAAAETLADEGVFVSVLITSRAELRSVLASLLETAGGALRWNPKTAYIEFILFREDYEVLSLPLFNEDNVESVSGFEKTTWYSLPQATQIVYNDRNTRYKPTPVKVAVSKLVPQHAARTYSETYDFICESTIALTVLVREFGKYAAPFLSGDINTNRDGFEVMPGDVLRLSWESFEGIVNFPMRITSIKEKGTLLDTLTLSVQQASYSFKSTVFAPPMSEATKQTNDIPAPYDADVFVVPYYIASKRSGINIVTPANGGINSDTGFFYIRADTEAQNFAAEWFNPSDLRVYSLVTSGDRSYFGTLEADIAKDAGHDDGVLPDFYINGDEIMGINEYPDNSFGEGLFFIGDEIFMYGTYTEITPTRFLLSNVRRGLIDTVPTAHITGDEVLFLTTYNNVSKYGFDASANPYDLFIQSTAGFNKSSSGLPFDATVTSRFNRPAAPINTMVFATAGGNVSPRISGLSVARGSNQYVSWKRRDRMSGAIALYDAPEQGAPLTTYTVTIVVGAYSAVLATGIAANETLVTIPAGATVGAGTIEVKATTAQGDSLYSDFVNIIVT